MGIKMRFKSFKNSDVLLALVRQNKSLKEELEQLKGFNSLMQNKLFEYENEIVELELENDKLGTEVQDLQEQVNDLQIENDNLSSDNYNYFSNEDL